MIFDQYGRIKYHIEHRLDDAKRQSERLKFLWENGLIEQPTDSRSQFANIHRDRADAEFSMRKRKNPAKARGHSGK